MKEQSLVFSLLSEFPSKSPDLVKYVADVTREVLSNCPAFVMSSGFSQEYLEALVEHTRSRATIDRFMHNPVDLQQELDDYISDHAERDTQMGKHVTVHIISFLMALKKNNIPTEYAEFFLKEIFKECDRANKELGDIYGVN